MKKVLSITIMLLMAIVAKAQENKIITLDRDFNFSGRCILYSKKENPTKEDECNFYWELQNRVVGKENYPKLYIKDAQGKTIDFNYWNGKVKIMLMINDEGRKTYIIADDTFIHLRILEFDSSQFGFNEPVYGISLCSMLLRE